MSAEASIEEIVTQFRRETTVGKVCDQFGGEVQTGPFGSQLHASDYSVDGTPVVMPQDMFDGKIVCDRIARVGPKHVNQLKRHMLRVGDVVYSRRGDVTRFAVVTKGEEGWLCGTGSVRIRLNCPEIEIGYVRRYLQQEPVGKWLKHHAKGVTMPNLNTDVIRSLPFVYPPLAEQRRIAEVLDRAEALRAKRRAALAQLDSLTQSLFLDSFVANKKFPAESLDSICELITDGTHYTPTYSETGVIFLSSRNVTSGYITWDDVKFIPESLHTELHRRVAPKMNDILLAKNGTTGIAAIVDRDWVFDIYVSLALLRPSDRLLPIFLQQAINSPACTRQFNASLKGIGVPNLHLKEIRKTTIPVPPIELQSEFARRVTAVEKLKTAQRASLAELDALFATLQHRAFCGELGVPPSGGAAHERKWV